MASNPRIPEHGLSPQGRIYSRATYGGESIADIAPDFKGSGATPQEKADETKAWISKEQRNAALDGDVSAGPQPDVYAQELNKRLGPLKSVMDTMEDGLHAAKDRVYGSSQVTVVETAGDAPSSDTGTISQYTQAAWEKVNELKPTLGLAKEPDAKESNLGEAKQQAAEVVEKGQHDSTAIAGKAKETTANVGEKLLAAGGDDVLTVLSEGGSSQPDASKANLRAATEMLS